MPEVKTQVTPKPEGAKEKAPRSNFAKIYPAEAKLTVNVDKNPKKAGSKSAKRFEGYFGSPTVGDALKKGVTYQDVNYDVNKGFIKVG